MLQSRLFAKTSKNVPEGEESVNAKLLIKGGFINKSSAGVYTLLPLGLRVLSRINAIVREEMNAIGAEELLMPALIHKKYWQQSARWDTDVIFRTGFGADKKDFEYGLGWTHEEVITAMAPNFINSYRDLPKSAYQLQTKFRAEARAQAGLLRGREFMMKDLYSFHASIEDLNDFYYKAVIPAYKKVFERVGLKVKIAEASGGAFTKEYTHEFQVINPAGEDTVYFCDRCDFCQNKEVFDVALHKDCAGEIHSDHSIEVANIFRLGTRYSEAFNLLFTNKEGERKPVVMGSYGIGLTRILATLVEEYHDDKGIIWPDSVAPFGVHIVQLGDSPEVIAAANDLADAVRQKTGLAVLYDDRNASNGEKLNDADLLGIPWRAIVSEKTLRQNGIELKKRSAAEFRLVSSAELLAELQRQS